MVFIHHHRFQCTECTQEAELGYAEDKTRTLTCRTPECFYEDSTCGEDVILYVMLKPDSLANLHPEIRRILDERQAPPLRGQPWFKVVSN